MRTNKTYITFSPMTSFFCHFWHSMFILYSEPRSWNPERSGSIDCASTWNTDIYKIFKPQCSLSFVYNLVYIYNKTSIWASLEYIILNYNQIITPSPNLYLDLIKRNMKKKNTCISLVPLTWKQSIAFTTTSFVIGTIWKRICHTIN